MILKGLTPYSQSRYLDMDNEVLKKRPDENCESHDERIWREKGYWNSNDQMIVPRRQIRVMLSSIAQYKSMKVEGQGQSTYTKYFKSGILINEDFSITDENRNSITKSNVEMETIHVVTKGGNRLTNRFPIVRNWIITGSITITDPIITKKIFTEHLNDAGVYMGLGHFRVGNGGNFGTFKIEDIKFST